MSKQELLRLMRLLSGLESSGLTSRGTIPDYLLEELNDLIEVLEREILK